jgi:hypothetical protein
VLLQFKYIYLLNSLWTYLFENQIDDEVNLLKFLQLLPIFKLIPLININNREKNTIMSDEFSTNNDSENYDKDLATGKKADKNTKVRQRIDDLLEKKRLREAIDDSEDWEI